jgi:hypothetical protein
VNQVHEILLELGHGSLGVNAIVPALTPHEASEIVGPLQSVTSLAKAKSVSRTYVNISV